MKQLVQEIQVLGNLESFIYYSGVDVVALEKYETYQKRSYRNRYDLVSSTGLITLSIPLKKGKHASKPIVDVAISYEDNWERTHLRTIKTCYENSPFFEHYYDGLVSLFHAHHKTLWSFNTSALTWACTVLGMEKDITFTEEYLRKHENLHDLRNVVHPRHPSRLKPYSYPQVFEEKQGFIGGASILDLIFNLGPEAKSWLKAQWLKNEVLH